METITEKEENSGRGGHCGGNRGHIRVSDPMEP